MHLIQNSNGSAWKGEYKKYLLRIDAYNHSADFTLVVEDVVSDENVHIAHFKSFEEAGQAADAWVLQN